MKSSSDGSEITMIRDMIRTSIERGRNKASTTADIWKTLIAAGIDRLGASDMGGLRSAVGAAEETGRALCAAPVIATASANLLADDDADLAAAIGLLAGPPALVAGMFDGDRNAGTLAYRAGHLTGSARFVEYSEDTGWLLVLVDDGAVLVDAGANGITRTSTPTLGTAQFAELRFADVPGTLFAFPAARLADSASCVRLMLAARALGAAGRGFEMVTDYVQHRVQFGQPLARFQAMQHKLADCYLAIEATSLLITNAAEAHSSEHPDWRMLVDSAVAFAASQLRRVSLETHHAFGAIGYAEEHEAPQFFRRVHSDLIRMGGQPGARARLAARLIDSGHPHLAQRNLDDDAERFRGEVRDWLARNWTEADRAGERARPLHERGSDKEFARKLGADGWLSIAWPETAGGKALSPIKQLVLAEELSRAGAPTNSIAGSAWLIAPEIARHGTPWLQDKLLPGMRSGEIALALGYSEPNAGSDLTALQTRAVRDGDDYVINGQKLWGTETQNATHIALAVRTDPSAPRAAGISVIIVPADLPGITIQPTMAFYGHLFCTQFYEDVRVPAGYLLGPENGGWSILTGALAAERIQMGGMIVIIEKLFEDFCALVAADPMLRGDPRVRDIIGQYAAELEAARQLSLHSVKVLDGGRLPLVEGALTKLWSGDLTERFSEAALDILGTAGLLSEGTAGAPLGGSIEQTLRRSIMMVIGGGAAEIQKTLVAQRGLGLPR